MAANRDKETIPKGAFRILVTGFGPFGEFKVNPSWLAVKPLHDTILTADSLSRVDEHDKAVPLGRPIHVTTLEVPTEYEYVLNTVPGFHARPPVLPLDNSIAPPHDGYDFILHVGVAPPGPLRVERLGHKSGYTKKDASGELAPIIVQSLTEQKESSDDEESKGPLRGFAAGYETFPDVLATNIDVDHLVKDLQQSGTAIQTSDDAGRYLCDFIYYCSLAESRRSLYHNPPDNKNDTPQVLFLHCCPVGQPFTTEEVTEGIKRIVVWVCNGLQARGAKSASAATSHGS